MYASVLDLPLVLGLDASLVGPACCPFAALLGQRMRKCCVMKLLTRLGLVKTLTSERVALWASAFAVHSNGMRSTLCFFEWKLDECFSFLTDNSIERRGRCRYFVMQSEGGLGLNTVA